MSAYVAADLRQQVREHFENRCGYCQTDQALTVTTFEVEHITPRSAGGGTVFDNLCFACPTCNRCKSNRTVAIDPATNQEVPLYRPNHDDWPDHFTWSDDGTEIISLTPTGRATVNALRMNRRVSGFFRQSRVSK